MVSSGSVTLNTYNTYTGGTTVSNGTLALNTTGGTGAIRGTLTINQGGLVRLVQNNALGYTSGVSVSVVTINGGVLDGVSGGDEGYVITAYNLTGGSITSSTGADDFPIQSSGTVNTFASNVSSVISGQIEIRSNPVVFNVVRGTVNGPDLLITGAITNNGGGSGGLTKVGNGLMAIAGSSSYSGGTTISAGTLQAGNGTNVSGTFLGTGGITNNATLVFNEGPTGTDTIGGAVGGAGTILGIGSGLTILTNTNSFTGNVTLSSGTLRLNGGAQVRTPASAPWGQSLPRARSRSAAAPRWSGTTATRWATTMPTPGPAW